MEFKSDIPIYLQIVWEFQRQIAAGELKAGDKIPSVRETAVKISVNPNTVSRSYQELERLGITETKRGMGTYIVQNENVETSMKKEMAEVLVQDFITRMEQCGFSETEILEIVKKNLVK